MARLVGLPRPARAAPPPGRSGTIRGQLQDRRGVVGAFEGPLRADLAGRGGGPGLGGLVAGRAGLVEQERPDEQRIPVLAVVVVPHESPAAIESIEGPTYPRPARSVARRRSDLPRDATVEADIEHRDLR